MQSRQSSIESPSDFVEMIRFATMAPSGHNTQPWKFSLHENTITIFPDYKRRLAVVDPDDHALFISLGCALENLIITESNDKQRWIELGKSFEKVVLTATQRNIKHAHLNMPCEEESVRKKLQKHLGLTSEHPLLLLRIGYAGSLPDSLRRPVEDVVTERR
ncbi:hypothetical protein GF407_14980 [candidate division KSB1 bacterium]|nr:hypothetical protein [candidate division KSB1 bacterium]